MLNDETFSMPTAYDAKITDEKWYAFWEEGKFFVADASSSKPSYSIVIPPPNVTGVLHMGHALVNTLQDILIRWKRMSGFETLWLPGTDHAGIATQTVVEKHLLATQGKRRSDYTREEFLSHVWGWKEKSEKTILSQLKRLGSSCDWSRLRFTMDEGCNRAVKTIFKKLFDAKLIYRGNYLVNWDPVALTALADDEVEYEERASSLWYLKYPLKDSSEYLVVATTRPETMLGDTAVAVHPDDKRYSHLIGKKVVLPIVGREIPIIGDHHIDPGFGSGVVKITPAHDINDYRMGQEHQLPMINIFTPEAKINENGAPFIGFTREEARHAVVEKMRELGLLEKTEEHTLRVGLSYRSKAVIEPYLSKQWFVNMTPFAKRLQEMVNGGQVKIVPKSWEATYFHWINNLRDWCISRQLWWGHRIPVWYHKEDETKVICYAGEGLPPEVEREPHLWTQDPDVLDTWFSSALWPFSTLGWPDNTPDLKKFYPTSVLVTGHDILFFWVARMMAMGDYALNEPPFPETFLHGLIYGRSYWKRSHDGSVSYITGEEKRAFDLGKPLPKEVESKWEKLSKSKGNVIDPLEMIAEYGTDAVRMSLCASANQSPQIDLDRRRFEEFRNFANKVWNGARFVFLNIESLTQEELAKGLDLSSLALEDKWILSALNRVNDEINTHLTHYAFDAAAHRSYDFFWKEFCAYYVEIAKPILFQKSGTEKERIQKQKLLAIVLSNAIRLLHPIAPFITEELFQILKKKFSPIHIPDEVDLYTKETLIALQSPACAVAPYPKLLSKEDIHPEIESKFSLLESIIYTIRNIRGEMGVPLGMATDVYIVGDFRESTEIIKALVKTAQIIVTSKAPECGFSATGIVGSLSLVIPLPQELSEKERIRLNKELEKTKASLDKLKNLINNPEFIEKAHPQLIEKQRQSLNDAEKQEQIIIEKIRLLNS